MWQLRETANWVNLSTPAGLALAWLGRAEISRGPHGLRLATGYGLGFPVATAFTVGSVVLTRRSPGWLEERPHLLAHEERHASQYAMCGGLPFIPLYLLATAYSQWKVGDRAAANVFERLAGLESGGYRTPTPDQVRATKRARRQRGSALAARFTRLAVWQRPRTVSLRASR